MPYSDSCSRYSTSQVCHSIGIIISTFLSCLLLLPADLLTEDGIAQWAEDKQDEEDASRLALFKEPAVQAFVAWINDNDDDDEEEEEEGEEEDEEEDEDD